MAASGYPASRAQLEWLAKNGVNVVLTLTEDPLPADWTRGLPMTFEHISLRDHASPDPSSLDKGATYIDVQLAKGKTVLVHCLAGEGRTGCVLAAYLIKNRGISASEALANLRRIKPAFVEGSQEKAVFGYEASLK